MFTLEKSSRFRKFSSKCDDAEENSDLSLKNAISVHSSVFFKSPISSSIPKELVPTPGSVNVYPKVITLVTSMGNIGIEMYWLHSPYTCKNFYELCKISYFDNCKFHRIINGFIIQSGDPTGSGRGGKSIYGDFFDDEIHHELKHTGAGIVSMANCGKNTNASQFLITLSPVRKLDGNNAIFGRVFSGMNVVKNMSNVQTKANDEPIYDVKILRTIIALS